MKKVSIINRWAFAISIITALTMFAGVMDTKAATAPVSLSDAYTAYHRQLNGVVNTQGIIGKGVVHDYDNIDTSVSNAELIDFDNNGIPELLYTCGMGSGRGVGDMLYVYGYSGKLDLLYTGYIGGTDDHAQGMKILKGKDGKIYLHRDWNDVHGQGEQDYSTIAGGKWTIVLNRSVSPAIVDPDDVAYWYVNGKTAAKSEYDSAADKLNIINERNVSNSDPDAVRALLTQLSARPVKVIVNNKEIAFDQPPVIENGRTLVPIRAIVEAMGGSVTWNDSSKMATIIKGSQTIKMQIGNAVMTKNNAPIKLDVPPKIIGNRTLIPARAIAEAFGASVDWNANEYIVYITY